MSTPIREECADDGTIERVVRKLRVGDEPSQVAEYARFTVDQRLQMFLRLRQRVIKDCYGTDPGFERVYSVTRIDHCHSRESGNPAPFGQPENDLRRGIPGIASQSPDDD